MILKVDKNFHWYKQVKCVEKMFRKYFRKSIELQDFHYENFNFGIFYFKYYYFSKDFIVHFILDKFYFSIDIERNDGVKNDVITIISNDSVLKNIELPDRDIEDLSSIKFWIEILARIIKEDRVKFYQFRSVYDGKRLIGGFDVPIG